MAKEAISKVIEVEEEARRIVREAKEKSKEIISSASVSAKETDRLLIAKAKAESRKLQEDAREDIKSDVDEIGKLCIEKCEKITKDSALNIENAKKYIVERIVK